MLWRLLSTIVHHGKRRLVSAFLRFRICCGRSWLTCTLSEAWNDRVSKVTTKRKLLFTLRLPRYTYTRTRIPKWFLLHAICLTSNLDSSSHSISLQLPTYLFASHLTLSSRCLGVSCNQLPSHFLTIAMPKISIYTNSYQSPTIKINCWAFQLKTIGRHVSV